MKKNDDFERVEGYDTHRLYNIEEFIFDDPIKELAIKLVTQYRDEFKHHFIKKPSTIDNGVWVQAIPLLEELKSYYNNDICISTATSIAILQSAKFNLRIFSYYYENALFRIANAWEYVHIILNQVLESDFIVGKDIRERVINAKCHNIHFEKYNGGYRPVVTLLTDDEKKIALAAAEQENKLLEISSNQKKSRFHKFLKKKLTINERLQNIFDIYYSDDVSELMKLRNEVVHRRPLGAKYSVSPSNILPGQCISINPNGWYQYHDSEVLLEKNIYALRKVIGELLDMVFNNDLPNKKNEGKHFYMQPIFCNDCKRKIILPDITLDYFQLHNMNLLCPYCITSNLTVLDEDKIEANDNFYFRHLDYYNENIVYKHKDLVFNIKKD